MCRIDEKTEAQLSYVKESHKEHVFVKACPGAGKTEVVGLKTSYEINRWDNIFNGLAVLTFTNNAADVITARAKQFLGVDRISSPHYIGTFDSWLHSYLAHPFSYLYTDYQGHNGDRSITVIEDSSSSSFLDKYCAEIGVIPKPRANQYYFDFSKKSYVFSSGIITTDNKRNALELTKEHSSELNRAKYKFWRNGYATYQDIEIISLALLLKYDLAERLSSRFPFIIVDECQDLSWIQLEILDSLIEKGTIVHFVGDLNQSIYDFKSVDPQHVRDFVETHKFKTVALSDNFRSCQPIVDVSQQIISGNAVVGVYPQKLDKPCICIKYDRQTPSSVISKFEELLVEYNISFENSAVLIRNWDHADVLVPSRRRKALSTSQLLASALFYWTSGSRSYLGDALILAGAFVSKTYFNSQPCRGKTYYYSPTMVASTVAWRMFLANLLDSLSQPGGVADLKLPWKQWAGEVRKKLSPIIRRCSRLVEIDQIDWGDFSFKALNGESGSRVIDTINQSGTSAPQVKVTTVHSVKGQTLDAVLIVQPPGKRWKPWAPIKEEDKRVSYVACSRPRKLLAWGVASNSSVNIKEIEKFDFEFIEA